MKNFTPSNIVFVLLCLVHTLNAQLTTAEFLSEAGPRYHTFVDEGISNFSCRISSDYYVGFINQMADSTHNYPLKFYWLKESDDYYFLQPLPQMADSVYRKTLQLVQIMKNDFENYFAVLEDLYMRSPTMIIPPEAITSTANDTVNVAFGFDYEGTRGSARLSFTRAGQLWRSEHKFKDHRVLIQPTYSVVNGKWLCTGWRQQNLDNNEVSSGYRVQMDWVTTSNRLFPQRAVVVSQYKENQAKKNQFTLFFKDVIVNDNVQALLDAQAKQQQPAEAAPPAQASPPQN